MSTANQRAALSELRTARPAIDRLDAGAHPEELAADLIEAWTGVETSLRTLMGGSALAGQPLIRELRQRQLINLDQAHCLLEMLAVRERVQRADYLPTADDVQVSRDAYATLEKQLTSSTTGMGTPVTPADVVQASPSNPGTSSGYTPYAEPAPIDYGSTQRRSQPWWFLGVIAVALIAAVGVAFYAFGRTNHLQAGIDAYGRGQREQARREFDLARAANPNDALPHVYLGRIAREMGDTSLARTELTQAVTLAPQSAVALRELGSFLFSRGQLNAAAVFYVRAIKADTADRASMGWLGCTLVREGRTDEGVKWLSRAGRGDWSACTPQLGAPQVGTPPAGAPPPGAPPPAAPR